MLPSLFTMKVTTTVPCTLLFCATCGYFRFLVSHCMNADQPPGNSGIFCTTVNLIGASACVSAGSTAVSGAASFTSAPSTTPEPSPITSSLVVVLIFSGVFLTICCSVGFTSWVIACEAGAFAIASALTISFWSGGVDISISCERSSKFSAQSSSPCGFLEYCNPTKRSVKAIRSPSRKKVTRLSSNCARSDFFISTISIIYYLQTCSPVFGVQTAIFYILFRYFLRKHCKFTSYFSKKPYLCQRIRYFK